MPQRLPVVLIGLRLATVAYAAWSAAPDRPLNRTNAVNWGALSRARLSADSQRGELTLELPPVELPAGAGLEVPTAVAQFPLNGAIYGFHAELRDQNGRLLPISLLHHVNVMDPAERELFLPISRRILAAGTETGEVRFPWLLFGACVRAGERVLANAMLHNPTGVDYHGVRVRMVVSYVPDHRPWPLFSVLPWQLDVAFPVGDKSFDLPPGRSERSYEGSPAVAGKLLLIGGHMHEYGKTIELWDATTGKLLWHGEPEPGPADEARPVPPGKLYGWSGLGIRITPAHRYRVRVVYENPTGRTIVAGGMGVVGGIFMPSRRAQWPAADPGDSLYQQDLRHFIGQTGGGSRNMPGMDMHSHSGH
jgi:hypothetical protein